MSGPGDAMTPNEFLAWEPGDGRIWQLIEGRPVALAQATPQHGAILTEAVRQIANHLKRAGSRCRVLTMPAVQLGQDVRVPDLAVTGAPAKPGQRCLTDMVLAVEIISEKNELETWLNLSFLKSVPSVQEILVLDSRSVRAEIWRRREGGTWPDVWPDEPERVSGTVELRSIGFSAPSAPFYAGTVSGPMLEAGYAFLYRYPSEVRDTGGKDETWMRVDAIDLAGLFLAMAEARDAGDG